MADSDASLLARVAAHDDRAAFELLLRRHQVPLRNFLRRLTAGDIGRADDIAQETFIKAYYAIRSFRGGATFRTWLYRIAYNAFVDSQRKSMPATEFVEAVHGTRPDPAGRADTARDVNAALGMLSLRQQAVFDLCYRKGMSHAEIAAALEMPLGTVKSDLNRGHARLREILKLWGFD